MAPSASAQTSVEPFHAWLERCRAQLGEGSSVCGQQDAIVALASEMPTALARWQRESAHGLLTQLLCRALAAAAQPLSPALTAQVLALLGRELDEAWRHEWSQLVDGVVCERSGGDLRVTRSLAQIERRYVEPAFRLSDLARALAISPCRLTQLLKAETGSTFGAHVQRRRIARAAVLLGESALSIKEIAGQVGYQTTTQLDRHFKRHTSFLPSAYRRLMTQPRAASHYPGSLPRSAPGSVPWSDPGGPPPAGVEVPSTAGLGGPPTGGSGVVARGVAAVRRVRPSTPTLSLTKRQN